jgi:Na+-driven multidrug efflux pump
MGMQGVAAGSLIANGAGAAYLWIYLASGRARVSLSIRRTAINKKQLKDILRVGAVACVSPL